MTGKPESRVALVTHVSSPILAAAARRLAASGVRVMVCGADPGFDGGTGEIMRAPEVGLTSRNSTLKVINAALDRFGRLDVLVLGVENPPEMSWPDPGGPLLAIAEPALQTWISCVEAALPALERSQGRVVSVVSSIGRYRSGYFRPENSSRSAAPAALANGAILALTRQIAAEFAPKKVRINAVLAGLLEGDAAFTSMTERERRFTLEEISLGRLGKPEEVAAVVAFLASEASNYLSGDAIDVNGGWWMS